MDALVDDEAFDLMEHRGVGSVAVRAVDPARSDHPQGCALRNHRADLDRAGVRPEQHLLPGCGLQIPLGSHVEGVVHGPRGVAFGHVKRGEIVPVVLDFRPGGDRETHVGKDLGELVHHLADRVDRAFGRSGSGERQVERLGGEARIKRGGFQSVLARCQGIANRLAQAVNLRPFGLPGLGRHRAERLEQPRNRSRLAEQLDPQRFERIEVCRRRDAGQRCLSGCRVIHLKPLALSRLRPGP